MAVDIPETNSVVGRLMNSFDDLEHAIHGARASLSRKDDVPQSVFDRLDSYQGILGKQRSLTRELAQYVKEGNVGEVGRLVNLINGLSGMIIDDARQILTALSSGLAPGADDEPVIC